MSRRIALAAFVILLLAGVTYGATRPGFEEIPPAEAAVEVVTPTTSTPAPTTAVPTTTEAPPETAPETTTTYITPTTVYVAPEPAYTPPTTVWVEPVYQEPVYQEPVISNASSGDQAFLECVMNRESGGDPTIVNPSSGSSGLFQYLDSTWANLGYAGRYGVSKASYASASQQWEAAHDTLARVGRSPWAGPGCG